MRLLPTALLAVFAVLAAPLRAQDFRDDLPPDLRLNGGQTVKAFGDAGVSALASTLTVLADGKPVALATCVDADGHFVTKHSELDGAEKIQLRNAEGAEFDAVALGCSNKIDLALLKTEPGTAQPVRWGDADALVQGTWIAGPTAEAEAIMIGVISATRRSIERRPGVLGVNLDPNDDPEEAGVAIDAFGPNSPASKAGMLAGDLIIRIQDLDIYSRKDLAEEIRKYDPLDEVRIKILRGDEGIPFLVTLNYMSNVFDMLDRNQRMSGSTSKRKAGFADVLQHELPLSPAAMGGPLLDLGGEAVGVNIARADRVTTFALPASVVAGFVESQLAGAAEEAPDAASGEQPPEAE